MPNPDLDQDRVEFLRARESSRLELLPAWPRPKKELRVVEVEVDWVRFSTLNHRTRAEQFRAIHEAKRSNLFTADPLGKEAQEAQFKILRSQEGFDELKNDLRERRQQEGAVITAEGVLINGNRRAAALRSLYHDDHVLDARYVRCLVLPEDATANELVDLEAELQIARDFKQDYSWVNEAMLIEEIYEREGRNFGHVARKMHRDESSVRALYQKLQQLHQLVAISNGTYLHIDFTGNESAFDELAKHIKSKPKLEQDSVRATYFLGTLTGVNYRTLRHLQRPDAADLVYKAIDECKALQPLVELVKVSPSPVGHQPEDPLDALLGTASNPAESNNTAKVMGLLSFLATKSSQESVALESGNPVSVQDLLATIQKSVESAANDAAEENKDATAVTAPVTRVNDAIEKIKRAIELLPKARTFAGWAEEDFQDRVGSLRALVERLGLPTSD